ncbi:MAG: sigma-70 family RNA polymerase sigma factor [Planctomycetes bacterium]|nr:sigma-70 family RNA polymerase sigma factor [Planctomycetota bacterium]
MVFGFVTATMVDQTTPSERLVQRHLEPVRRYLVFLGCPTDQLADLVQDTFLAAFAARVPDDERAAGWLCTAARFRLGKLWRARRRTPVDLETADAAWPGFARDDDGDGWLAALRACVEELPPRSRQVVQWRYHDALGLAEIAPRLGLATGGVETLLGRVRRWLRGCVERRLT